MNSIDPNIRTTRTEFSQENVPVFVICFNRLDYLRRLVSWLERSGFNNIILVDNASDYPPLKEYLSASPHRVEIMEENLGHLVVWESHRFDDIIDSQEYIVTDCDVVPDESCPLDAGYHFHRVLSRFPYINKVGFGLRIDDIPPRYHLRDSVIKWEKQFWTVKHVDDEELFNAAIDTTFALYRPGIRPDSDLWWVCARTGFPYVARHLPWYEDSAAPSVEEIFYQARVKSVSSHWTISDLNTIKQENTELRRELGNLRAEIAHLRSSWDNRLEALLRRVYRSIRHRRQRGK